MLVVVAAGSIWLVLELLPVAVVLEEGITQLLMLLLELLIQAGVVEVDMELRILQVPAALAL